MRGQAVPVEGPAHGAGGSEQTEGRPAGGRRHGIGDVQEGHRQAALQGGRGPVHVVRAQQDEVRAGRLERLRLDKQQCGGVVPPFLELERADLAEVQAAQQQRGAGQSALTLADQLVGDAVVQRRRLPAHPAQHADGLHRPSVRDARDSCPGRPADRHPSA